MREVYDFAGAVPNPYVKKLRKQISLRVDVDTISYFKTQSANTGIPYQNLINLYLKDCADHAKTLQFA